MKQLAIVSKYKIWFFSIMMSLPCVVSAQDDPVLSVMEEELKRETDAFSKVDTPPYFISYRITDEESAYLNASFGSLIHSTTEKTRFLVTQVRVGDYAFDNTHPADDRKGNGFFGGMGGNFNIPYENSKEAIQYSLWQATQNEYKQALDAYKQLKNSGASTDKKSSTNDFSKEPPSKYYEKPSPSFSTSFDKSRWTEKIKKYSEPFIHDMNMVSGDVTLRVIQERRHFVSSEGSRIAQNMLYAYLYVSASIRATDGEIVPLHLSYFAFSPSELPGDAAILKDVADMIEKLKKLKDAPLAEPYSGPAILHSQTAGVFFHEIFGHRIEGHRLRNEYDGQTFLSKIKEQVLPKSISVTFDPTITSIEGTPLNGCYQYDDEGVKSRKVDVVDKGILKTFLMSRTPLENIPNSNGHARAADGAEAVSRQSNLVVETSKPVSMDKLRKMLIKECQKQGKKYGYLFQNVIGGFTTTDRYNPNAFNIFPTEVYRIYVDGRPDELVRGVDLIGTPLAMFAEITASGDKREVFTGFCGAESGNVPVSAVAPSLFVRRIETQKKPKTQLESPLIAKPFEIK